MSMQCICTIQSSASRLLTSGKSTSRDSRSSFRWPRGHVRNWRVGIQSGIPFGACFWKNEPPARPSRQRFIVNGRSRRCGTIVVRDVAVVAEEITLGDAVVREEDAVGGRQLDLVRHCRTAHMTLARLGIAYVPSGISSASLAITASCSAAGLLAIQLIVRALSSRPLRSSTWSCGNASSATGPNGPRAMRSLNGGPAVRRRATERGAPRRTRGNPQDVGRCARRRPRSR